jgi:flagellar protein FliO/FliZ
MTLGTLLLGLIGLIGLLALALWLVRRFQRQPSITRGRHARFTVVDTVPLDGRRNLVLIRRDNVEHLLMIGGPTDVVIEPNIVPAKAPRPIPTDTIPHAAPLSPGGTRPLGPQARQRKEPPPRPELPSPAPPVPARREYRPRPGALAGLAEELARGPASSEAKNIEPTPPVRGEPRTRPSPPPTSPAAPTRSADIASAADRNLAQMAQRLEAALRHPPRTELARPTEAERRTNASASGAAEFEPNSLKDEATSATAKVQELEAQWTRMDVPSKPLTDDRLREETSYLQAPYMPDEGPTLNAVFSRPQVQQGVIGY